MSIRRLAAPLYVVSAIINASRYHSRYRLYHDFAKYMTDAGAVLYTVEAAFGDRDFEVTDSDNCNHIRVRTQHELWHKENLINIGVSRLPADWRYVAWVDADVQFARKDIVQETMQQLQHFSVVQMFSQAIDLDPRHRSLGSFDGLVSQLTSRDDIAGARLKNYGLWHPGYAWACRRDAWDHLGGLIDFGIVGSADHYMACGLIGEMAQCMTADLIRACPVYAEWCFEWQRRAERYIKHNIGFVDGLLLHYFHGSKQRRGYSDRSEIVRQNRFDPVEDIKRDSQGVWQLSDQKIELRDQLRAYFRSRDEDGTTA
jgi:hypothetical protein